MATIPDGTAFADHGILIAETEDNTQTYRWRTSISVAWDNTIGPPPYGDPLVTAWTTFLKGLMRDDSTIVKVSLYPYVKGRQPLSLQGSIWSQVTTIACKDWGSGSAHPSATSSLSASVGEVCVMWNCAKFPGGPGGRNGRFFVRNAVSEELLKPVAGGPPIMDPAFASTVISEDNAWAVSKLGTFCTGSSLPKFVLIHASKRGVPTGSHDIFDTQVAVPVFERLAMHDIDAKSRK